MTPEPYNHLLKSKVEIPSALLETAKAVAFHAGCGAGDYEVECIAKAVVLWLRENTKPSPAEVRAIMGVPSASSTAVEDAQDDAHADLLRTIADR